MPTYTYKCVHCATTRSVALTIAEYARTPTAACSCGRTMIRDYRADRPQPAPMWPEHLNPSSGTVVRTRQQLADDLKRKDADLYARTGIEQNSVVIEAGDQ